MCTHAHTQYAIVLEGAEHEKWTEEDRLYPTQKQ